VASELDAKPAEGWDGKGQAKILRLTLLLGIRIIVCVAHHKEIPQKNGSAELYCCKHGSSNPVVYGTLHENGR
jgi:hypothetical protein